MTPIDRTDLRILLVDGSEEPNHVAEVIWRMDPAVLPGTIDLRHAETLAEGFEIVETTAVDLVVLDLSLPESSGLETLHRYADRVGGDGTDPGGDGTDPGGDGTDPGGDGTDRDESIPVVVLTGPDVEDDDAAREAIWRETQGSLRKADLDPTTLERAIHTALEHDRQERELKRQRRRLSEFASTVSHDLRNPLMVVRGRVELLDEDASDSQIETIERNLDRMEAIIEDTVTVAREGQPVEETEPVDVGSVAETCWQHLDTGSATLDLDGEVTVDADADRLDRLFEHLFDNVVEHGSTSNRTRSDSAVTVTVGALAGDVDGFYVEDDGPGIPADERDRVFEPGYTTAGERTGFGLCIVRELAEAHGWAVSLVGGSDGGARFEFAADAGARFARP